VFSVMQKLHRSSLTVTGTDREAKLVLSSSTKSGDTHSYTFSPIGVV